MLENIVLQQNQSLPVLTTKEIKEWLISYLADLLEIETEEVDSETNFARYGIDSSAAVILTGDLESWLGKELEPNLLYDYPTISKLSEYLTQLS